MALVGGTLLLFQKMALVGSTRIRVKENGDTKDDGVMVKKGLILNAERKTESKEKDLKEVPMSIKGTFPLLPKRYSITFFVSISISISLSSTHHRLTVVLFCFQIPDSVAVKLTDTSHQRMNQLRTECPRVRFFLSSKPFGARRTVVRIMQFESNHLQESVDGIMKWLMRGKKVIGLSKLL